VFPDPAALLRLARAALVEQYDQWDAADRRYLSEAATLELTVQAEPVLEVISTPRSTPHNRASAPHDVREIPLGPGTSPR